MAYWQTVLHFKEGTCRPVLQILFVKNENEMFPQLKINFLKFPGIYRNFLKLKSGSKYRSQCASESAQFTLHFPI